MTTTTVIHAAKTFLGDAFVPAAVVVEDETIVGIEPFGASLSDAEHVRLSGGQLLMPGLVDTHVHVNEPGRTNWEGFVSATRAAAAGGVTTIIDMPLNSVPPTVTPEALALKRGSAAGRIAVDVGFWGGAVPDNLGGLATLWDGGVFGFKCFLSPSGVDEFPELDLVELADAMMEIAAFDGLVLVHAEDPAALVRRDAVGRHYVDFLATRPPRSEEAAIEHVIEAARASGTRVHILHLSDAEAMPMIAAAKASGVRITVETCPHYLVLAAEGIPDGATEYKCCPPIRGADNQERLWEGVLDGTIDAIVSDHSPAPAAMKRTGDFGSAWGGISGLQLGLAATLASASRRGIELERILPLFTTGPARIAGFDDRGTLAIGTRADLVVFDPDARWTAHEQALQHRQPVSAYEGHPMRGRVVSTWLRGTCIYRDDEGFGPARGRESRRPSWTEVEEEQ